MTQNHGLTTSQVDKVITASELTQKHIGARIRFRYPNDPTVAVDQAIEGVLASYSMTGQGVDVHLGKVGLSTPKLALSALIHVEPAQRLMRTLGLH